ncbi:MAG: hypothetical protein AB7U75_07480 [Hyphomicrobiaceae bacterium]
MARVFDVLSFRELITPILLEVLFWAGIGGTAYGTVWLLWHNHWAWWMALVFGSLHTRFVCEFTLLAFRSYDRLVEIAGALRSKD